MARKIKEKVVEGNQFVETNAQDAPVKDVLWNPSKIGVESETHLEDDEGHGDAIILRRFEYGMNPAVFKERRPTKQEVFNSHLRQIEIELWKDGMKIFSDVEPRIIFNEQKGTYYIFVTAKPQRGQLLHERPKTLSQIAHNKDV